jgi:hypothetical protein
MKQFLCALVVLISVSPATAGVAYDFVSVTSGLTPQTIRGTVEVEGPGMRVDFASGDGVLFKKGCRAVTSNGGKTLAVIDPAAQSFYQLDLSSLLGGADGLLKQFGGLVKFEVENPRVSVRESGSGPAVAGFPTRKSNVTSSYELIVNTMGQKLPIRMQMTTDVWWTDKLAAELTNPLQMRGMRTGIDALDKLLETQTKTIRGFPLKQITTTRIVMKGSTMTSKTTSEVSNVRKATFAPGRFAVPAGYVLAPSPLDKLVTRR